MEKYSQFRDKGSGISPFLPVKTPLSIPNRILHTFLFFFRLPFFIPLFSAYFLVLHHLPLPVVVRKTLLWALMCIPAIWWVDLQLDGVRRGTLAEQPPNRVPYPGSVIAANLTSPIDALYLAAIFDPVFTRSYPSTKKVEQISLLGAIWLALAPVRLAPPPGATGAGLTDLETLQKKHPDRVIAVFPECSTTNGKAILPLAPSLLGAASQTPVFPVSIRYTPGDVTTPVPGLWFKFLWELLSLPRTCIRVRVAESIPSPARSATNGEAPAYSSVVKEEGSARKRMGGGDDNDDSSSSQNEDDVNMSLESRKMLEQVAEALSRLGRSKRVGLTLKDKQAFVKAWNSKQKK